MSIEADIARELEKTKDPLLAAARLLDSVQADISSAEDLTAVAQFALKAGALRALCEKWPEWFRRSPVVPWAQFLDFLGLVGVRTDRELRKKALEGATKQDAMALLLRSHAWDGIEPSIEKARAQLLSELHETHQKRHQALKDKLLFLRSQRMIEEEQKVLAQLAHEYPMDQELEKEMIDIQERWAREVVARARVVRDEDEYETTQSPLTEAEKKVAKAIAQETRTVAQARPDLGYDFVLIFHFMGLYDLALEMAEFAPQTPGPEWLKAELLYLSGRYIEGLDHIHKLEMKYQDDPETAFSANYLRALCHWRLKQTSSAIELMRSLVAVRPDYRSARSFLTQWHGSHLWGGGEE